MVPNKLHLIYSSRAASSVAFIGMKMGRAVYFGESTHIHMQCISEDLVHQMCVNAQLKIVPMTCNIYSGNYNGQKGY